MVCQGPQLPILRYEEIRGIANSFCKEFPTSDLVYPIEKVIELDLRIELALIPNLRQSIDAVALLSRDCQLIWIDEYYYNNREPVCRFGLAHEIGHIRVHGEWDRGALFRQCHRLA